MFTRVRGTLHSLATISSPVAIRRIQVIAGLTLLERLLTPAAAWIVLEKTGLLRLGVALALSGVFSLRTFSQRVYVARAEADILERVIAALVEGDVLQPNVLPGRDARAELAQAVYRAATGIAEDAPRLVADGIASVLLMIVILAVEPPRVVLLAAGITAIAAAALAISRSRLQRAAQRAWDAQQAVFLTFVDALEGRLEVVAAGKADAFLDGMRGRTRAWARASTHVASATIVSGRLPVLAIAAAVVVLVSVTSASLGSLGVTLPDLALFACVTPAFAGVAQGLYGLVRVEHWTALVAQVIELPKRELGGSRPPTGLPATVLFERVSFAYGHSAPSPALSEVLFQWQPGRVLAVAGTNGSGKSTCLRLMLGLARPSDGILSLGGVPLHELDLEAWRREVAFLPQRPYMPPMASVRAGIRFLAPEASDDAIRSALRRVGLFETLVRSGADPLDASVETLSVGERQRVAIARLLCRKASVYLLDEPDANLDRDGIVLCARLIRELAGHAMVAFAAHTPELIEVADDVVTLERGRVVGLVDS